MINQVARAFLHHLYDKIIFHYGGDYRWNDQDSHNIDKKRLNFGFGLVHYALIRAARFQKVLVIGSMYGFIPYMLARACQDNGKGKVDFVDAAYGLRKDPNVIEKYGDSFWKKTNFKQHFSFYLNPKYISFHKQTSEEFKKQNNLLKWEYVYIDGDHSYNGVKTDFNRFWPTVVNGGLVLIHDINKKSHGELEYGVSEFWHEIKTQNKYRNIELPGECGLGIIIK